MAQYQPAILYSPTLIRLPCPKCRGAMMTLALIEPDKPGWEQRTFECQNCGHNQTSVVEIK